MQELEATTWLETLEGDRIPLRGVCTFGRTSANTVVLPNEKVSRHHAMIHQQGFEFWIVDLGSTNGVQINGVRVTHPLNLQPGDQIQMPGVLFIFKQVTEPETASESVLQMTHYEVTKPEIQIAKCWMLLADLQGFTQLSQQVVADELAPLVGKWMANCQDILQKQKGVLGKFLGDGFLAYWIAHDDTAELIAMACRDFQALQESAPLPFRIALHYGEVAFGGQFPDASNTMLGMELNYAFRLERLASQLKLLWIFSGAAERKLYAHLPLVSCGLQRIPDFEPDHPCFTLET